MEEQLIQVLASTQQSADATRKQAELDLKHAQQDPAYPLSLANIASHAGVATEIRQSALTNLRLFIEKNWSANDDGQPVVPISDEVKDRIRPVLLELALSSEEERKIKTAASYVVGKIANVDFPEKWPVLLPTLLRVIPTGTDGQLHGALRVLSDLVEESLSDDQFFSMAQDIVKVAFDVAMSENRKPIFRALAISVFRSCFDLMDIVKEEHPAEVKQFAQDKLTDWFAFFMATIKMPLPQENADGGQPGGWNGIVAMKLQSVKCLMKIKGVFPELLKDLILEFWSAIWTELVHLEPAYNHIYVDNEGQGRLEDSDGLPYTVDFLVLEELDFLNSCLKSKTIKADLDKELKTNTAVYETPWVLDMMKLSASYGGITREEQDLWDIDVSLYLAEETSISANYTARTACGDLLIKLGEWLNQGALEALYTHTKTLFADGNTSWRRQEASLFLLTRVVSDFLDCEKPISQEMVSAYLELVHYTIGHSEPLLRARGYVVAGLLAQCSGMAAGMVDRIIEAINSEESELVQVACLKAIEGFLKSGAVDASYQVKVVGTIAQWIQSKDMEDLSEADDLLVTLAETLRAAIDMDRSVVVSPDVPALDLLFLISKYGAENFQVTMLICEAFEEIVQTMASPPAYQALCQKVLPSLTATFDAASVTDDEPLVTFATELMASLTQYGSEPLPPGFVAATLPKLTRLLMESNEGEILRPGAESVKYLLAHDHEQMFNYHDDSKGSGLEICLLIIDRLLGPGIEDNAASEVGGLAAELVEKAGHQRLGPYLAQLLNAVASRLSTAQAAPFIQSLILVFARLSLVGAQDVVQFLSELEINGQNGLQVVLGKWLENSVSFAGYDEIRQNVIALSKLYSLNDPRVAQTMVKGNLIMPTSDRIMTRSRTKQTPDQYTIIPAPLKILKVLIEELLSASGANNAADLASAAIAADAQDEDGDDDWEDDPDTLDLSTKYDLSKFLESNMRHRDDETQGYLSEFFIRAARENIAGFADWYSGLAEEEKTKLNELANGQT